MKCRESLATCSSDIFHLQPICDKSSSNDPGNEGVGSLSFELQNNKMFPFVGWLVVMTKSRRNLEKILQFDDFTSLLASLSTNSVPSGCPCKKEEKGREGNII